MISRSAHWFMAESLKYLDGNGCYLLYEDNGHGVRQDGVWHGAVAGENPAGQVHLLQAELVAGEVVDDQGQAHSLLGLRQSGDDLLHGELVVALQGPVDDAPDEAGVGGEEGDQQDQAQSGTRG